MQMLGKKLQYSDYWHLEKSFLRAKIATLRMRFYESCIHYISSCSSKVCFAESGKKKAYQGEKVKKITINGCFYAKFLRKSQKSITFAVANCFIGGYLVLTAGRTGM